MNTSNRVCALLGMELPIIQAGMVWCSGWELASAVSGAGGLGILGAGSMYPEVLRDQIQKVQAAAPGKPFAVNVPLLYPAVEEHMASIVELGVPIVFTSAGNPRTWTKHLQHHGINVVHVVSSVKFALKAQEAGVDAVVAEGFEAGGHNGREETTTMCLVPAVADACDIPVIAAGGLHDGRSILAAMMLGADAVQLGIAVCGHAGKLGAHRVQGGGARGRRRGHKLGAEGRHASALAAQRLCATGDCCAAGRRHARRASSASWAEAVPSGACSKATCTKANWKSAKSRPCWTLWSRLRTWFGAWLRSVAPWAGLPWVGGLTFESGRL